MCSLTTLDEMVVGAGEAVEVAAAVTDGVRTQPDREWWSAVVPAPVAVASGRMV